MLAPYFLPPSVWALTWPGHAGQGLTRVCQELANSQTTICFLSAPEKTTTVNSHLHDALQFALPWSQTVFPTTQAHTIITLTDEDADHVRLPDGSVQVWLRWESPRVIWGQFPLKLSSASGFYFPPSSRAWTALPSAPSPNSTLAHLSPPPGSPPGSPSLLQTSLGCTAPVLSSLFPDRLPCVSSPQLQQ